METKSENTLGLRAEEIVRAYHADQTALIRQLVEALEWSLAELRGQTKYDNPQQALNCFAQADAAILAAKASS